MSYAVDGLARAQTGLVIGKAKRIAALGHACQLSAALPVHRPAAVAQRVSYAVIAYGLAVIRGQQVAPFCVAIGIGSSCSAAADCAVARADVLRPAEDIAAVVVGVVPRLSRRRVLLPYQLAEIVILICRCLPVNPGGRYVAVGVVGVGKVLCVYLFNRRSFLVITPSSMQKFWSNSSRISAGKYCRISEYVFAPH